jgi:hypothetical protein
MKSFTDRGTHGAFGGGARVRGRRPQLLLFLAGVVLLGAGMARAAGKPGHVRAQSTVTISNGSGDGTAQVTVDPYGEFGSGAAGPLLFDPAGATGASQTTFYSSVWFSGPGQAGEGGKGVFLGEVTLDPIPFTSTSDDQAVSDFTRQGIKFHLVQRMLPSTGSGSVFEQVYTITNTLERATRFDMIRHFDGDLQFDASVKDSAGASKTGQLLYEFDSAADPNDPTTFVGVDLNGNAGLGFQIAPYKTSDTTTFYEDILDDGRAVLKNELIGPGNTPIDDNGDRITDEAYDVTLNMGRTYSVPAGGKVRLVVHTLLGEGAPGALVTAPSNLLATPTGVDTVRLDWTDNSPDEDGFWIERSESGSGFTRVGDVGPDVTTFGDTDLREGTTYRYRVQANFDNNGSPYTNVAEVTTFKLNAPGRLRATTVSDTKIHLEWEDNNDAESGFVVERKTGTLGFEPVGGTEANETEVTDSGLEPGTSYTYRVRAILGARESEPSNTDEATTFLMSAPSDLRANVISDNRIDLSWTDNSLGEDGFVIQRLRGPLDSGMPFNNHGQTGPDETRFSDREDLLPNTIYNYRVRAIFGGEETAASETVTVKTPRATDMFAPEFVDPTPDDGQAYRGDIGAKLSLSFRAHDEDENDEVTIEFSGLPEGAEVLGQDPEPEGTTTRGLIWVPVAGQEGTYPITVTATDLDGKSVQRTITVLVENIGVCANGTVGAPASLRINGSTGWPSGKGKIKGGVVLTHLRKKQTFASSKITRIKMRGKTAFIEGVGRLNGRGKHQVRLVVEDGGQNAPDRIRSVTIDGKAWPGGRLTDGDVHFHTFKHRGDGF